MVEDSTGLDQLVQTMQGHVEKVRALPAIGPYTEAQVEIMSRLASACFEVVNNAFDSSISASRVTGEPGSGEEIQEHIGCFPGCRVAISYVQFRKSGLSKYALDIEDIWDAASNGVCIKYNYALDHYMGPPPFLVNIGELVYGMLGQKRQK